MWTATAFYAAVEMQRRPELRDKPVAVCGRQEERHGIVLTANYLAKPRGVKTGQAIWQARQCCPELVILPPDIDEYIRISKYAREISRKVKFELGITVSIGVANNKITAKLGSNYKKPDAITRIEADNYKEIVYPLPVKDLLYVGPATSRKLRSVGISTIGRLAEYPEDLLVRRLGKIGAILHAFANGRDTSPV